MARPRDSSLPVWTANPMRVVGPNPHPKGRDIAVGDIHGFYSLLQTSLDQIGFDPLVDRLFSVGDLVDRGPESHLAVEWLSKPWFFAVMGNHEFMAWREAEGRPYRGIEHARHGGAWLRGLDEAGLARARDAFRALPCAMEVRTRLGVVGMVHADFPFDDWAEMSTASWAQRDDVDAVIDSCLWKAGRYDCHYLGEVRNARAVIQGHLRLPSMAVLGNVYYIDTGGWDGGKFTLLDMETLKAAKKAR